MADRLAVLDDDVAICEIVRLVGSQAGFSVQWYNSVNAFRADRAAEPAVIILDLCLADRDGIEVLRTLAGTHSRSRIILMTGADPRVLNTAERIGIGYGLDIVATLRKPFAINELRAALETPQKATDPLRRGNVSIEHELHRAIGGNELVLHYQPKIRLDTGRIVGAEALVRWHHPTLGLLPPGRFIPVAERAGLMLPLTHWVLQEAIRQLAEWRRLDLETTVAVNVPPEILTDIGLPDSIETMLRCADVPAGSLTLEVTETGAMKDILTAMDVLTRFRLKGISLAIDDFGTGYSSLIKLHRMPFNEIKIDRSFIEGAHADDESRVITETIINMARSLGMEVVAEGVENTEVLDLLIDLGCDVAQGFLLTEPLPADEYLSWYRTTHAIYGESDGPDEPLDDGDTMAA
ncbi:MAG TPA: EAL domain-containing response regulator [Alphaproteobacteria bacterium]|jgi:EAL domain-containing protein (putative c-di-GMP-specific phosphodiesterase class I)